MSTSIAFSHLKGETIMPKTKMMRVWDALENDFSAINTPHKLDQWLRLYLGVFVPRRNVCPHHQAPFDYLWHAYREPTRDVVVWAPRGGGKTRLAAVATLLDMLHKPHTSIRILG